MQIRFLQTVASENPNFPFVAGQLVTTTAPSEYLLSLIDGVRAIVIRSDDTERAIAPDDEQPEPKRKRGRPKRAQ